MVWFDDERWCVQAGRHLYTVLFVGVVLVAATFIHYISPEGTPSMKMRERSRRRMAALHAFD